MTKQWLIDFLKALEAELPPPKGAHHIVWFGIGWENRLFLTITLSGGARNYYITDEAFSAAPQDSAFEFACNFRSREAGL